MCPVIEDLFFFDQTLDFAYLISWISSPEDVVVSSLDNGDGIDLDVAEVLNDFVSSWIFPKIELIGKDELTGGF